MPVVAVVVDELSGDGAAVVECLPQLSQILGQESNRV